VQAEAFGEGLVSFPPLTEMFHFSGYRAEHFILDLTFIVHPASGSLSF
jgi:hypothetical protein